jgi:4-nitrophenyl phosphatase
MQGFIIDLDGTLYRGNSIIAHAAQFVNTLQEHRLPYLLVTNNSSRTPDDVAEHLAQMDIHVSPSHILTSAQAAAWYMKHVYSHRGLSVYCIGERGLQQALTQQGYELVDNHHDLQHVDFVVQGIDRSFDYSKLVQAIRYVDSGAIFINTNPDRLLPSDRLLYPGAGSIAASIQYACGIQPIVIGKPSSIIIEYAIEQLGIAKSHIWVVGDNVATDILGGYRTGCKTALVLTGITTPDNLLDELAKSQVQPDIVCDDLRQLASTLGYT